MPATGFGLKRTALKALQPYFFVLPGTAILVSLLVYPLLQVFVITSYSIHYTKLYERMASTLSS